MTSPKPLTEKLQSKQKSHKDKQTTLDHFPDLSCQDCLILGVGIHSRDPESGPISHYINASSCARSHSIFTAKMTDTHQEELFDKLRVLCYFIE